MDFFLYLVYMYLVGGVRQTLIDSNKGRKARKIIKGSRSTKHCSVNLQRRREGALVTHLGLPPSVPSKEQKERWGGVDMLHNGLSISNLSCLFTYQYSIPDNADDPYKNQLFGIIIMIPNTHPDWQTSTK